jgi:PKD repeat protein
LSVDAPTIANAVYIHPFHQPLGYYVYPCSDLSYTLSVSNPNVSYTYNWYDASIAGNLLGTGTSYTIPSVAPTTQTIWVEPDNGTCIGSRVEIIVSPIPTPQTPTYTGSTIVCKGSQLVLAGGMNTTGQLSGSYYKFHWYDAAMNNILTENDTLKINNCQNPFMLWFSVVDSIPANPSIGRPLTVCESGFQQINVTVDFASAPIVSFTNPTCIYNPTTLTVTNASSNAVNWYDNAGNLIYPGNPLTYTNSHYTDNIFSEIVSAYGCHSIKTQSVINVQHMSPAAPIMQNIYATSHHVIEIFPTCSNFSATINVNQPNGSYIYDWYDAPVSGNLVNVGSSYTVPNINYTGYYEYWIFANDGTCHSSSTDLQIKPIKTPGTPHLLSTITHICKNDTLILIATKDTFTQAGGNFYLRWYNSSNQLLHTGDTLIVPGMQITTTFYCSEVDSIPYNYFPNLGYYICEGQKTVSQITVDSASAPIVPFTNPSCIYSSTTLSASNSSGLTVNWYSISGNSIHTGNPFIYTNTHYADTIYCAMTNTVTGCQSRKTQLVINVQHVSPAAPTFQNTYTLVSTELFPTCSNSSATINVYMPSGSYMYNWYDAPAAGNIVNVGSSNTLPSVNYNTAYEYWVSAYDGTCMGNRTDIKVQPIKTPGLPQITSTTTHICRYDTLVLIASKDTSTQAGGHFYLRWYNASNQLLHTGDTLIVDNIQSTATYYCSQVDSIPYHYFPSLGIYLCEGQKTSRQITVDTVSDPIVSVPSPVCAGRNVTLTVTNSVNSTIRWFNVNGSFLWGGVSYTIPSIQASDTVLAQAVGLNTCKSKNVRTIVNPQKPLGDFMSVKTILNSGDIIQFNNLTIGGNTWAWDFGDGSNSTSQSPHHYFYNPGYYNITLIVTSAVGCTDTVTKNNYIEVLLGSGVNEYSILKDVKLFPNPFTEGVWLDIPVSVNSVIVSLKSIVGQELRQYSITGKEFISLSDLSEGIYIMRISKDNETVNIKIVRE